jgi:hypothetical protein
VGGSGIVCPLVSLDPAGRANRTDAAFAPMISADGQSVAIHSRAANLVADDYNASFDVFLATLPTFAPVPGDFDGSGVVDEADYSIVRSHFGSAVPPGTMGDANGDRIVDNADYVIWRKNLGAVVSGSGAALGAAASEDNLLKSAGPVANLVQPPAGSRASVYTTVASNARLPAPNGSSAPLSGRDSYSLDHASRRASIVRDNAARVTLRSSPTSRWSGPTNSCTCS